MSFEKVLRGAVLTGVFAMPFIVLIVAQTLFFPFITGKNFAFRAIVEITALLWLSLALVNPEYRPRRSWILASFALFVLVIGIADMFGVNAFKSFWSNYERMEGWLTLAHLFAYLMVMTAMLNTERLWRYFFQTTIGVSILVGFFGIFQLMNWTVINQGGVRLDATFGNAIYLAIYMLFHLFIVALLFARERLEPEVDFSGKLVAYGTAAALQVAALLVIVTNAALKEHLWIALPIMSIPLWAFAWARAGSRMRGQSALVAVALLQMLILFFTASRGAMIGLAGGALLSALLLVVLAHQSRNAWRVSVGVVFGIIVLAGSFFLIRDAAWVQRIEPLARLASISANETTVASRFYNMSMALEGLKERPFLGWGQENYNTVFNKHFDPRMYKQEQWFDRTHNIVFDWLIAGGILGFLAYVLIYVMALFALWRSSAFTISERSILTGLLAGYAFSIFFVFDNITSYIMFVIVLAYIASRSAEVAGSGPILGSRALPRSWIIVFATVALAGSLGLVYVVNGKAFMANRTLIHALRAYSPQEGGLQKNIQLFKEAIAYNTYGTQEMREQLIQGSMAALSATSVPAEDKRALLELAVSEMEKQAAAVPDDARFPFFLGALLAAMGQQDAAKPFLEKALELSPKKQVIELQLAFNAYARGDKARALELARAAYEEAPQFAEPHVIYASLLIAFNDPHADEVVKPLIESGEAADQRLISAYVEKKRFDKVAEIWQGKARINPQDPQARFALAASFYAAGNKQKAIDALAQAAKDIPAIAPQAEQYITQIKNGTIQIGQ